ncbi:ParM/StbA family protein [Paenibacillus cremeus]|uniref:ParM/StbA family protein n=1 Tax=Paenibacillus cremeus TaxID=2163881 RepID=A0A559K4X2_9BACL|nr:ParM/StbA family protein [Paenibacillus cremeus]TVY07195.1 ParM/StbA family protein [Paenibacillus cremeus]
MVSIVGLDVGRNGVKVCAEGRLFTFPSIVGDWNERKLVTDYSDRGGYEIDVQSARKFIGTLAENESINPRHMLIDNKATDEAKFLALTALHLTGFTDVIVVTGLPVEQHVTEQKKAFRDLLFGQRGGMWDFNVNGERRLLRILDVKIAVEGGAAFWSAPQDGLVRLIDAGSKTVNYVTMKDRRYIYRDSGTLSFGLNTKRKWQELPIEDFAAQIAGELGAIKWSAKDAVLVSGGRANELAGLLRQYFPLAAALPEPLYANAIGYYRAGRSTVK